MTGLVMATRAPAMQDMTLTEIFDEIIAVDARGWMFHTYDRGSAYNVHVDATSATGRSGTLHGFYTYNNGMKGWAKVVIVNGSINCLEFHDFQGTCRRWGRSESWPTLGRMIGEASRQ
jgi:hypothetical protein